jgi:hypothetical protein
MRIPFTESIYNQLSEAEVDFDLHVDETMTPYIEADIPVYDPFEDEVCDVTKTERIVTGIAAVSAVATAGWFMRGSRQTSKVIESAGNSMAKSVGAMMVGQMRSGDFYAMHPYARPRPRRRTIMDDAYDDLRSGLDNAREAIRGWFLRDNISATR